MLKEKSAWLKRAVRTGRAADQSAGAHPNASDGMESCDITSFVAN